MSFIVSGSAELKISAQLMEWCYTITFICRIGGTLQHSHLWDTVSPWELTVSASCCINSTVQTSNYYLKVMIQTPSQKHQGQWQWEESESLWRCFTFVHQLVCYLDTFIWRNSWLWHLHSFDFLLSVRLEMFFCEVHCYLTKCLIP